MVVEDNNAPAIRLLPSRLFFFSRKVSILPNMASLHIHFQATVTAGHRRLISLRSEFVERITMGT